MGKNKVEYRKMTTRQTTQMMLGAGLVWLSDLLLQAVLAEVLEDWTSSFGRWILLAVFVMAGMILLYQHLTEEKQNCAECEDSRRRQLSTLSIPEVSEAAIDESPSWAEHNFHTPIPYKTPHPCKIGMNGPVSNQNKTQGPSFTQIEEDENDEDKTLPVCERSEHKAVREIDLSYSKTQKSDSKLILTGKSLQEVRKFRNCENNKNAEDELKVRKIPII